METNPNNDFITAHTGNYPGAVRPQVEGAAEIGSNKKAAIPGPFCNDPDICPRCGARRSAIKGMLGEPVNSPVYQLGKEKVLACRECRAAILETTGEKVWLPKR